MSLRFVSLWRRSDLLFKIFAQKDKRKSDETLRILHDFTNNVIIQRRRNLLNGNYNVEPCEVNEIGMTKKMAFLDILLQSTIDGVPLTDTEIQEEVDAFMFAVSFSLAVGNFSKNMSLYPFLGSRYNYCYNLLYFVPVIAASRSATEINY